MSEKGVGGSHDLFTGLHYHTRARRPCADTLVWLSLPSMTHSCWERRLWTQTADVTLGNPNRAPAPALANLSSTSLSSFTILLEPGPGFHPGKGSGQWQLPQRLPWRKQNYQRQPSVFPLGKASTGQCPSLLPAVLGHQQTQTRGPCLELPQKAP